jgi:hypothetical protein
MENTLSLFLDSNFYSFTYNYTVVGRKVRCTPCTGTEALYRTTVCRGSRGIALLFLDHGTRKGWGVNVTPWPLFTPGKDTVPIVQEAGWTLAPIWTGAENLVPTVIRSPDRPALANSYTDDATRPTYCCSITGKYGIIRRLLNQK